MLDPISPTTFSLNPVVTPVSKKLPISQIIFGIFLIIAITVGVYLYLQFSSRSLNQAKSSSAIDIANITSDWQLYKNTQFSFKYPQDWVIKTKSSSDSDIITIASPNNSLLKVYGYQDDSYTIAESVLKQDEKSSIAWEGAPSIVVTSTKISQVDNAEAIQRVEDLKAAGLSRVSTYIKNQNSLLQIILEPQNGVEPNGEDAVVYDHIIGSFKFSEPDYIENVTP